MGLFIYLLRHGETSASQTGGYCGSSDPELTSAGFLMAKDFARAYGALQWSAIHSSPLRRAVDTAGPLCKKTGLHLKLHDGLKEMGFGRWEGKHPDAVAREFHDDYIRWLTDPGWNAPTGGEQGIGIARKSLQALEEIAHDNPAGNVLVVSHKATIRIMLCSLLGIDIGRFRDRICMPVGAVSIVEMAHHGPLVHLLGDRSHLRKSLRNREID